MAIALHFDVLNYVEKAEKLGIPNDVAKFQAREIESLYTITIDEVKKEIKDELLSKEFATKSDIRESELRLQKEIIATKSDMRELELRLQKEIAQSKNQVIIWIGSLIIASGMLQHFFK